MNDQSGFLHFFEGRAEGSHQALWQSPNKSDRVREQDPPPGWEAESAYRGIERSEHTRGHEYFGAAESVKKRGFSGIRVADQRDRTQRHGITSLATQRTLLPHVVDTVLDFSHSVTNATAISF